MLEDQTLVSGGVDGRIHLWSSDITLKDPLFSIPAHDGRVSFVTYAASARILFSTGYDGRIIAYCRTENSLTNEERKDEGPSGFLHMTSSLRITDEEGDNVRITAGTIIREAEKLVDIALGTADGLVLFVRIKLLDVADEKDPKVEMRNTGSIRLLDSGMIFSMASALRQR